jgi:hypothetical protein
MDVVAETWVGRIFYGTIDIGSRNSACDDSDQTPIERMMGQHHELLCRIILEFLQFC